MKSNPTTFFHLIQGYHVKITQCGDLNSRVIELPHSQFLCTPFRSDEPSVRQFYALIRTLLEKKDKMVCCLFCSPEGEWELISAQPIWVNWIKHQYAISNQIAQITIPTKHFNEKNESRVVSLYGSVERLVYLQNVDACRIYCNWIAQVVEKVLNKIKLEELDSYTLEAHLKNFIIEDEAMQLRHKELNEEETVLKLGALQNFYSFPLAPQDATFALEKQLVRGRAEIEQRLKVQLETLAQIVDIIPIIESAHPNLTSLKRLVLLARPLLNRLFEAQIPPSITWGQQLMLLQLLHEEMDIATILSCDTGLQRTQMAFSVMAAISLFKEKYGIQKTVELVLNWNETQNQERGEELKRGIFDCLINLCPTPEREINIQDYKEINDDFLSLLP